MSVAAVVLAAGFSRRLGRSKQDVEVGGETLLARAVRVAFAAGMAPVIVVLQPEGAQAAAMRAAGCEVVENAEAAEGIASSIRCGVGRAEGMGAAGAVILTCDQVLLDAGHLRALCAEPTVLTGSLYARGVRVPAYFPAAMFPELLALQGDEGARVLLRGARGVACEALAVDVDTEEDLGAARQVVEGGG